MLRAASGASLVLIGDFHPAGMPNQFDRSIQEVILAGGALAVLDDLQRSGLPDIDVSNLGVHGDAASRVPRIHISHRLARFIRHHERRGETW